MLTHQPQLTNAMTIQQSHPTERVAEQRAGQNESGSLEAQIISEDEQDNTYSLRRLRGGCCVCTGLEALGR